MTPSRWTGKAAALGRRLGRRPPSTPADDGSGTDAEATPPDPDRPGDLTRPSRPVVAGLRTEREEAIAQVMRAYRAVLGRPADQGALAHYVPSVQNGSLSLPELCAELVHSAEFAGRLEPSSSDIDAQTEVADGAVDVRRLLETLTAQELARAEDDYYARNLARPDYYLAKPITNCDEAPDLLTCFAQLIGTIRPLPGMRVVDFGAGTGWSTRWLAQLGCEVVAVDVSPLALDVARLRFERLPVVGHQPEPTFLVSDGVHLDLPDESVDHIICLGAFHRVPDPEAVLAELGRVLRPGGTAGFAEPGPNHSKTAQSQVEMRNHTVLENDVVMGDVWRWAEAAGFTSLRLALFSSEPYTVPVDEYEDFLGGGSAVAAHARHVRRFAVGRRIFFLDKGEPRPVDSRDRRGLLADLTVDLDGRQAPAGGRWSGTARVTNTGTTTWLPASAPIGGVLLGVHLYDEHGALIDRDHGRATLAEGDTTIAPGRTVEVSFGVDAPADPGRFHLGFDLVSEGVCWFGTNGSPVIELPVTVTG
jgi:SAM-dependent methyltransferase